MYKIMIIEDDSIIREELKSLLTRYGYLVTTSTDFKNIIEFIHQEKAHIILLDVNLPVFDGYYICREIRQKSDVPIIMVTSRDTQMDELMSMNLGADDFITKPYNTHILLARLSSIIRRTYGNALKQVQEVLTYKDLNVSLSDCSIHYKERKIELTRNEMKILVLLITNSGNIISRETLMEHLWESELFVDDNTLSVNITRLRKKLEELDGGHVIETRRGMGYMMP